MIVIIINIVSLEKSNAKAKKKCGKRVTNFIHNQNRTAVKDTHKHCVCNSVHRYVVSLTKSDNSNAQSNCMRHNESPLKSSSCVLRANDVNCKKILEKESDLLCVQWLDMNVQFQ